MKQMISLMLTTLYSFLKTTKKVRLIIDIKENKNLNTTFKIKEDYMSPERIEYYRAKERKMAFYIVENEKNNNEENPPTVSAVIGLDRELEAAFYASRKPAEQKPAMETGMRVNRDITSIKKEKKPVKMPATGKRNGMHCPSLPTQWRNSLDIIIPKAEFGHFSPRRK